MLNGALAGPALEGRGNGQTPSAGPAGVHIPAALGSDACAWSPSLQSAHKPSVGRRTLRFLWFPKVPGTAAHPDGRGHK